MKYPKVAFALTLILACVFASVAAAQEIQGTGDNWGSGYRSDGNGELQGTGDSWAEAGASHESDQPRGS